MSDTSWRTTRRGFLKAAIAPAVVSSRVFGADAPSNRINVALIGAGNQSRVDLPGIMKLDDVQVVAICDVNRGSYGYRDESHFLGREPVCAKVNEYYAKQTGRADYNVQEEKLP